MAGSEKPKYPALRIIAAWYKLVGYFVGGIVLLAGVVAIFKGGSNWVGAGLIAGALVFVILSMAIAEIIQAFLDTENNTRSSAGYLKDLLELQVKNEVAVAPAQAKAKPMEKTAKPTKDISESQAQSIRGLIRNLHDDGMLSSEIAHELSSEGLPTLDGAGSWTSRVVDDVLRRDRT